MTKLKKIGTKFQQKITSYRKFYFWNFALKTQTISVTTKHFTSKLMDFTAMESSISSCIDDYMNKLLDFIIGSKLNFTPKLLLKYVMCAQNQLSIDEAIIDL